MDVHGHDCQAAEDTGQTPGLVGSQPQSPYPFSSFDLPSAGLEYQARPCYFTGPVPW
jgi:hypothetical protein